VEVARVLIGAGADLEYMDDTGFTALMWACEHSELECARLLIDAGACASFTRPHRLRPSACVGGGDASDGSGRLPSAAAAVVVLVAGAGAVGAVELGCAFVAAAMVPSVGVRTHGPVQTERG
jgi:ankyrin repeat protein